VTRWVALGDRAIRFARPAGSARALVDAARAGPGVVDVVVAREDVAVYFDCDADVEPARIDALGALRADAADARDVVLRARYDGEDLASVAAATGLSVEDVIRRHAAAMYTVDTIGFAPGFAYLAGLDPVLVVPRRTTPRPRVPAGALAIAADRTAIYPFTSPGGWHLVGTVDEPMFGPTGARLQLGDRVRFEVIR
jgi:KipI family sensor histidine kinase inhibitor